MSPTALLLITLVAIFVFYLWPIIVYPFQLRPYTIKNSCDRDCGIIWLTQKECTAITTDIDNATLHRAPFRPALLDLLKTNEPAYWD